MPALWGFAPGIDRRRAKRDVRDVHGRLSLDLLNRQRRDLSRGESPESSRGTAEGQGAAESDRSLARQSGRCGEGDGYSAHDAHDDGIVPHAVYASTALAALSAQ
jgi:hypothetical protein